MQDFYCYSELSEMINAWLEHTEEKADKISLLEFAAKLVKNDWLAFTHAKNLLKRDEHLLLGYIPHLCFDENGIPVEIGTERVEVDLGAADVAVTRWSIEKIVGAIQDVKKRGFIFSDNHHIEYIPELNVAVVTNGMHHVAAAAYLHIGTATAASVISLSSLYRHINTDGYAWYNSHTGQQIFGVTDWRFAALFSIKQLTDNIKNDRAGNKCFLVFSRKRDYVDKYDTKGAITLEELVDCVKEHRTINKLSIRAFAKRAGISQKEAFMFEHCSFKQSVVEKIMKYLSVDKCFKLTL